MKNLLNIFLVLGICLLACGKSELNVPSATNYSLADESGTDYAGSAERSAKSNYNESDKEENVLKDVDNRKLIKEGSLRFETDGIAETRKHIERICAQYKAYISSEQAYDYENRQEIQLEIRMPAQFFDSLFAHISSTAVKIESKDIRVRDVTEEFIDVEARLSAKKDLESRYRELMKQAVKVEEMLQIEREIGNLRAEIESIEGRLRYLKDRVAYSILSLTFFERSTASIGFFRHIHQGLSNGWELLQWFLIGLVNIWPFILIAAGIIYYFIRRRKKRKNAMKP